MTLAPPLVWTPQRVVTLAADAFGVEPDRLMGRETSRHLTDYRMVTYAACRRFCGMSYPSVGQVFHRDHSTVWTGCRRVESDPDLSRLYGLLAERLLQEGVA